MSTEMVWLHSPNTNTHRKGKQEQCRPLHPAVATQHNKTRPGNGFGITYTPILRKTECYSSAAFLKQGLSVMVKEVGTDKEEWPTNWIDFLLISRMYHRLTFPYFLE